MLETRIAGTDENGNLIVEAVSPGGLSVFGLLAVTAAPAVRTGWLPPSPLPSLIHLLLQEHLQDHRLLSRHRSSSPR